MKRSLLAIVVSLSALLLLSGAASAADEPLSPEALSIANALNCPVCTGESVRDSSSQLAHDIRQLIQQQLDQGMTRQQIMDYFVNAYGITILRQPPKHGFSLALWWIPVAALLAGAAILLGFLTQRRRLLANGATNGPDIREDDPNLASYEERIRQDVSDYESGYVGNLDTKNARVDDLPSRGLAGSDQGVS
ncbi:MAG TPA: cytochrome c-type biogenesis protein CcmH [Nitrolancea sp.]|nr:cytochrome c-type biogenesis protein CcmH [Nitrolancea sp.]